jgi:hypothetical protein
LGQIKDSCRQLLTSTSEFLGFKKIAAAFHRKASKAPAGREDDFVSLANLYCEIVSSFNKVHHYVATGNAGLALLSAVALQKDLDDHVHGRTFDLLSTFDASDLGGLEAAVGSAEAGLVDYVSTNAAIRRYRSVGEFLSANQ